MCTEKEKLELQKQLTEIKLKLCQLEEHSLISPITPDELIELAKSGQLTKQQLIYYLNCGGDINYQNEDGRTALIYASWYGHLDIVKLLVEKGAKIDQQNKWGYTALIYASWYGHLEIVQFLVEKGAKIDQQNKYGWTALLGASNYGHKNIVEYLKQKTIEYYQSKIDEVKKY